VYATKSGKVMRISTICVRSGSKGLPSKNKRLLDGIPLYAHSIKQAKQTKMFDEIVISTDDDEILEGSISYGATATIRRPATLSGDKAGKPETVSHAVQERERQLGVTFKTVVDLDATSLLRNCQDICNAIRLLEESGVESVLSATSSHRNPYFNMLEKDINGQIRIAKEPMKPFLSRQDAPQVFDMNAAVHVWYRDSLIVDPKILYASTLIYEMPQERSHDIDTEIDFKIVEYLYHMAKANEERDY
jgi:CMP-N,N'-diacetyllegionaminic acid synthase